MAKEVSFLIKIHSDGGAKRVTADAEEMGRVIREVQDEAEKAKRDVLTWAEAAQAVDVLQSSISELQAALTEMTADYQTSVVAQTQLATIMRQRMGSTEEEIQTIRDLCSAQQELGVVEDDIAASGAQQRLFYYVLLTCSFAWTARGQPKSVRITPCRAASRKTKLREALGFRPDWATTPGRQFTRSLRLPQPFGCLGLLKGYSTPRGRSSDNISSRAGCKGPLVATI